MNAPLTARWVRVQDLLLGEPVWRVNRRTEFLESRAGLTWTGVRKYRTPSGVIRVLHRPEQFTSPGFIKTVRRLPAADQHPAGDVDVLAHNSRDLLVGYTGDLVDVEPLNGYLRPVANVTVCRPETISKIVDAEAWLQYCSDFGVTGIAHSGAEPATGTSLGYNALWYGPYVESEIVAERDGALVGAWDGPDGPEEYDAEHVVDPDCEIVARLVRNAGFDASGLGGNHFAVALAKLTGRGAEQSELLRIVDSRDVIEFDPARHRQFFDVHTRKDRDVADWTVGADRDLPITEAGDWDGAAAAASVFTWAGWPDSPDPAKARRAFLLYDASAPELKGSYKLPIARYRDGRLEVLASGLRAAASYLPQTDAPQEVLDRARAVLDHYFQRLQESQADACAETNMTKQAVDIGLSRDLANALTKRGIAIPAPLRMTLDEMDARALMSKLEEMKSLMGDLMEMVGAAEGKTAAMEGEMKDMMSASEAEKMVAAKMAELDEAKKALEEAKAAEADMKKASDDLGKKVAELTAANDSLLTEVAPIRAAKLGELRDCAVKLGVAADAIADKDEAAIRRAVAVKCVDASYADASDDAVKGAVDGIFAGVKLSAGNTPTTAAPRDAAAPAGSAAPPTSSFTGFPRIAPLKDTDNIPASAQAVADGFEALGG